MDTREIKAYSYLKHNDLSDDWESLLKKYCFHLLVKEIKSIYKSLNIDDIEKAVFDSVIYTVLDTTKPIPLNLTEELIEVFDRFAMRGRCIVLAECNVSIRPSKTEAQIIEHCDDWSCDLNYLDFTCPNCGKDGVDYEFDWIQLRAGKYWFKCEVCNTKLTAGFDKDFDGLVVFRV